MNPGLHPLLEGRPGPWAVEWGDDELGVFESFAVGKVVQRMRWVPPGKFWMGSPESEAGRWPDEVLHEVELTEGFWLGETPCTQALWEAVMGNNPSKFVSSTRPVEQVSWDDCQTFLTRLNERMVGFGPEFGARLPTETEWEYACRAGTTTATWVGDLNILGECNAPILDAIAWYGGNSGHGFELTNGYDSSEWPNKQYPHKKAGTRPVALKAPNPLGLYDMLGNVWEWCQDWNEEYSAEALVDPTGPDEGSGRVLRGGSWNFNARCVRAACRIADHPEFRDDGIGFRFARGQPAGLRSRRSGLAAEQLSRGAALPRSGSPAEQFSRGAPYQPGASPPR